MSSEICIEPQVSTCAGPRLPAVARTIRPIHIALLGYGTVGRAFQERIECEKQRSPRGLDWQITHVLVRDVAKARTFARQARLPEPALTARPQDILRDDVDVVVEVMGGVEPARMLLVESLRRGRHVVTANKQLLASCHAELSQAAEAGGARIGYEATVCAAVPVIRTLQEGLPGGPVRRVFGVINGTCNHVLTAMTERSLSLDNAVREAQAAGFAESNPSRDLEGLDAAEKLSILCGTAFGCAVPVARIVRRGISGLEAGDIAAARQFGLVFRLLALGEQRGSGVVAWVRPVLVGGQHPLGLLRGAENQIVLESEGGNPVTLQGPGAGGAPTAGAVFSDLVRIVTGAAGQNLPEWRAGPCAASEEPCSFYVRITVPPGPGLAHRLHESLTARSVGLRWLSLIRDLDVRRNARELERITLLTRPCAENDLLSALQQATGSAEAFLAPVWSERRAAPTVGNDKPPEHDSRGSSQTVSST